MILRSSSAPRALFSRLPRFSTAILAVLAALFLVAPARGFSSSSLLPMEGQIGINGSRLSGQRYELKLHHLHTGEDLDIVYRVGNTYIPSALTKLNYFLRDHRTQDVSHYDPREFDLLHTLMGRLGRKSGVIDVVCGYRSPWSNEYLRTRGPDTGVAKNSQHTQAKAIDIRVPGITTRKLRTMALSLHGGGVGYYPISQFVHVDVGPVRQWTFSGRDE